MASRRKLNSLVAGSLGLGITLGIGFVIAIVCLTACLLENEPAS